MKVGNKLRVFNSMQLIQNKKTTLTVFVVTSIVLVCVAASTVQALSPAYCPDTKSSESEGKIIQIFGNAAVYRIEQGKRRPFFNDQVYKTWYPDFKNVYSCIMYGDQFMELGQPMPVKPMTKLVQFPPNPKIYAVLNDGLLHHIPDAKTASVNYGDTWESNIISLPEIMSLFYTIGPDFPSLEKPQY